jgi:Tesmin/TSO1-like CXC domain, cysteine-rich domain
MSKRANKDPPPPVGQVTYSNVASRKPPPPPPAYSPRAHNPQRQQQQQQATANDDEEDNVSNNDGPLAESNLKPQVAGVYAPLLRQQYQRHVENSALVHLPPHIIGGVRDQVERNKNCRCQKSGCLKLYCECFATGILCSAYCNCVSCHNDGAKQHQHHRNKAILSCLENNPNSFRPGGQVARETAPEDSPPISIKQARFDAPCNCTKSRCLKKYCQCFGRGLYCKTYCGCSQCYNVRGNKEREQLSKQMAQRAVAAEGATTRKNSKSTTTSSVTAANNNKIVDDGNLPPSYYALPMKLQGGLDSASLSFGWASAKGTSRKRKPDQDMSIAIERAMATEEAVLARRNQDDGTMPRSPTSPKPVPRPKTRVAIQSELEHKWAVETQDALGTFQAMRQELLERKRDAGLIGADIEIAREYSYYDLVGSAQLAAVELDLADVMTSVKDAEVKARMLAQKERDETGDPEEQAQLCDETMDGTSNVTSIGGSRMNHEQREEVIVQAAQDAALMRELARVIRRHALEMKEARLAEQQQY